MKLTHQSFLLKRSRSKQRYIRFIAIPKAVATPRILKRPALNLNCINTAIMQIPAA